MEEERTECFIFLLGFFYIEFSDRHATIARAYPLSQISLASMENTAPPASSTKAWRGFSLTSASSDSHKYADFRLIYFVTALTLCVSSSPKSTFVTKLWWERLT